MCQNRTSIELMLVSLGWWWPGGDWIWYKTSYHKISQRPQGRRSLIKVFQLLWNLSGVSAATLPRRLPNFKAVQTFQHPISCLWDFVRSYDKMSYAISNRYPYSGCTVMTCLQGWNYHFPHNTSNTSPLIRAAYRYTIRSRYRYYPIPIQGIEMTNFKPYFK